MKKLSTVVFTLLLAASLSFAQDIPPGAKDHKGDKGTATTDSKTTGKNVTNSDCCVAQTKTKKGHKGGKKSKKGASTKDQTPAPK